MKLSKTIYFVMLLQCIGCIPLSSHFNENELESHDDYGLWKMKVNKLRKSATDLHDRQRLFTNAANMMMENDVLSKYRQLFDDFVVLFKRNYSQEGEHQRRFLVFLSSLERHQFLNDKERANNGTATYGINKFSDWTTHEFQTLMLSPTQTPLEASVHRTPVAQQKEGGPGDDECTYYLKPYPQKVDWKDKVTRIKNQGSKVLSSDTFTFVHCGYRRDSKSGECYIFSYIPYGSHQSLSVIAFEHLPCPQLSSRKAMVDHWAFPEKIHTLTVDIIGYHIGAFVSSEQIEIYSAIKTGKLVERSPQELLSCSPSLGCEGGNTCIALEWLEKTQIVLETEKSYPYEEKDSPCKHTNNTISGPRVSAVCGCRNLVGREDAMLRILDQRGPLSVNVDAVQWHDYTGGIIQHHCTNKNMNHAVQVIGYDLVSGPIPYYIARNQWGRSFGEDGYVRIKYGDNQCGIAQEPSFIQVD